MNTDGLNRNKQNDKTVTDVTPFSYRSVKVWASVKYLSECYRSNGVAS